MPSNTKVIHLGPGEGDAISVVGDVCRILASGRQTGDAYTLHEIRVSPNNGPPPHIHSREDKSFFVLEGDIEFQLGDEKITARPGTFIQGPRGIAHSFKNNTSLPPRMLVFITPAGFKIS
jgi:quercetin dioxygenase-like cupin family protein